MSSSIIQILLRVAHALMYAFTFVLVIFAICVSAIRLYPNVSDIVEERIQHHLGNALHADIKIESLEVSRFHPLSEIVAENVEIIDRSNGEVLGSVHLAQIRVDLLATLFARSLRIEQISLDGMNLFVERDEAGKFHVNQSFLLSGDPMENDDTSAYDNIDLNLLNSNIRWKDDLYGTDYYFEDIDISIDPTFSGYRALLEGNLPEGIGKSIKMKVDINGSLHELDKAEIDFYLSTEDFHLSQVAQRIWDEDGEQVPITLTTEAWGVVENLTLTSLRGFIQASNITDALSSDGQALCLSEDYIQQLSMQYRWKKNNDSWEFSAININVGTAAKDWNETELYIKSEVSSENNTSIFAFVGEADVGAICNTLHNYSPHVVRFEDQLKQFRFNADLDDLKIRFDLSEDHQASFQYSAYVSNAEAWFEEGDRKITGLSAQIIGGDVGGKAKINSESLLLHLPKFYPNFDMNFNVQGDIEWMHYLDSFSLKSNSLSISNDDLKLEARLDVQKQDEHFYTDSQVYITKANANRIGFYFPSAVSIDNTKEWLINSIKRGLATQGSVLLRGDLAEFPFEDNSGVFQIDVDVSNGVLEYLQGWPELTDVQASVRMNKDRIDIYSNQAKIFDQTKVKNVHVYIDSFLNSVLHLEGTADGPAQNLLRFLADSGLVDEVDSVADQLSFEGDTSFKIKLTDSVSDQVIQPLQVSGEINFLGNKLNIPAADLELNDLNGAVVFDGDGVTGRGVTATIFKTPIFMSFRAQGDGISILSFEGQFNLGEYLEDQDPIFARLFSGVVPIQGTLYLPSMFDEDNPDGLELSITSTLQGLNMDLPAPFNKASNVTWPATVSYTENKNSLSVDIEKKLYIDFAITRDNPFDLRYLGLGNAKPLYSKRPQNLTIEGNIDQLSLGDWLKEYQELFPSNQNTAALSEIPNINLQIEELDWKVWPAQDIHLIGEALQDAYSLELKSSHADGTIVMPEDKSMPVTVNMKTLTLPKVENNNTKESLNIVPQNLQPIEFSSNALTTSGVTLRNVSFSTQPTEQGMSIDPINLAADDLKVQGSGTWNHLSNGDAQSAFSFNLRSSDLEDTFDDLGFKAGIKNGDARANLNLSWIGAPYDMSLALLEGEGEVRIKDGSIKEIDPGAGRLLALLNLSALTRRLSLDFKDVTKKGFAFDSIEGKIRLSKGGELYSRKIEIKSSAAEIRISGTTNLVEQTYDQEIIVVPSLSGTLPVAGAVVGGPVGAAAGVVVDRLARIVGLNRVVEYDYKMTGTWQNPVIKKLKSREVDVQTNKQPSGAPPVGGAQQPTIN
ncbi:MAG: YhdP family protein [Pseudomonadota bacterium]